MLIYDMKKSMRYKEELFGNFGLWIKLSQWVLLFRITSGQNSYKKWKIVEHFIYSFSKGWRDFYWRSFKEGLETKKEVSRYIDYAISIPWIFPQPPPHQAYQIR
jgi:hypothetical protein